MSIEPAGIAVNENRPPTTNSAFRQFPLPPGEGQGEGVPCTYRNRDLSSIPQI